MLYISGSIVRGPKLICCDSGGGKISFK
jgi:hypothetical protein